MFRKIFDWFTRADTKLMEKTMLSNADKIARLISKNEDLCKLLMDYQLENDELKQRLNRILSQETPGANATVRRMVNIALGVK